MFLPLSRRCRSLCRPSVPFKRVFSRPLSAAAAAKPPLNIVLVGAPGVGKGTYAKHMAPYLNITHVSTGDLVREYAKRDYDSFKKILAAGELVPDHEITRLLQERLNDPATASGVLLDGYPRNLEQVDLLDKFMDVTSVLHISLREDVLVRKCCARRMCPKCGENYNIAHIIEGTMNMPAIAPKREGICDKCNTHLQQRPDDVESVVRKRLELYKEVTHPIVQKYADRGQLITFELTSGVAEMLPKFIALCDERWVHLAHRSSSKATRPSSGTSRPGPSTPIQAAPQTERKASIKL